jgi:hypothetical protein
VARFLFIAIGLFLFSNSATAQTATNLINNSGFDQGLTGWANWGNTISTSDSARTVARTGTGAGGFAQNVASKVSIGASYRLNVTGRIGSTNQLMWVGVDFKSSSGAQILKRSVQLKSTAYVSQNLDFQVPAGTSVTNVYLWKEPGSYVYIDAISLVRSSATSPTPESTTSYVRPFGPRAPWNIPVVNLPRHPESSMYVSRHWMRSPNQVGNFNLGFRDFTYPVYSSKDATTFAYVSMNNDWVSEVGAIIDGRTIPWNPKWLPNMAASRDASGRFVYNDSAFDGQVIVLDEETGTEYDLWQVLSYSNNTLVANNGSRVSNYFTKEDGHRPSRGAGIQYLAMLVRPEEIAQGRIEHALSVPIRNPHSSIYLPPATKLERLPQAVSDGVPEGMRFRLVVTNAQIDTWLASLPSTLSPQTIRFARILAVALRDYGWIITDTAGGATFQFEAVESARAKWTQQIGIDPVSPVTVGGKEYPRDLLDGLLLQGRIEAVVGSDKY